MNSSTLRRLASDHAALHKSELPPHYLFPPSSATSSIPDDLTQLTILLTGPQGTPYSAGLWKLHLKIPHDYPKSPPKASFRTKIWHPNVEESTGSVCVDTLKRDWEQTLTLRDVLVTISCLLIQPNPDSALNATAGKLLQEDYESFARQAKLMTSIHANIPPALKEAVMEAKCRGEDKATKSNTKNELSGPEALKRRPQGLQSIRPSKTTKPTRVTDAPDLSDSETEAVASKENDPTLSPTPVSNPVPSPRRPVLGKRPLSDLPTPVESDSEAEEEQSKSLNSSEQNIANNTPNLPCLTTPPITTDPLYQSPKLVERSRSFNFAKRSTEDPPTGLAIFHAEERDDEQPTAKRVCSGEEKENITEGGTTKVPDRITAVPKNAPPSVAAVKTGVPGKRKASTASSGSGAGGKGGKARVGLKRL